MRSFSDRAEYGPPEIELGVAKKISITIMRLPRWKRLIAKSEALKSDLIFERVCRLVALINFAMAPRQPAAQFPNQVVCESPSSRVKKPQAIPGDLPVVVGSLRQS